MSHHHEHAWTTVAAVSYVLERPFLCNRSVLMGAHCDLRASALLALTKLMAIEPAFCDANLRLLFSLLHNR